MGEEQEALNKPIINSNRFKLERKSDQIEPFLDLYYTYRLLFKYQ